MLQMCTKVLNSLRSGEFGECSETVNDYMKRCHERFPLAQAFWLATATPVITSPAPWGHVLESQENCVSN